MVVTGEFPNSYPERDNLMNKIHELGGIITRSSTGITKKTDIVIVGEKAGPSKLSAIESHKDHIEVWDEKKLIEVMKEIG